MLAFPAAVSDLFKHRNELTHGGNKVVAQCTAPSGKATDITEEIHVRQYIAHTFPLMLVAIAQLAQQYLPLRRKIQSSGTLKPVLEFDIEDALTHMNECACSVDSST